MQNQPNIVSRHDYTFKLGTQKYGFSDATWDNGYHTQTVSLGPIGQHQVTFSATTGWSVTIIVLFLVFVVLGFGWQMIKAERRSSRAQQQAAARAGLHT